MSEQRERGDDRHRVRRRIDEVFGDPLPDVTSDEQGMFAENGESDRWYLENRPPHHDH